MSTITPNTNADNIIAGENTGTFVTTKPVIGYKKIECSSQWSLFGLVNFGKIKNNFFVAQVTIPKDETIIRPLRQYSAFSEDYPEPSNKLRTTGFNLDKIFHDSFTSINKCHSLHDSKYEYTLGAMHKPDKFDSNEHYTCTNGLHFFTDKKNAEEY
jgi:hypothetical protein